MGRVSQAQAEENRRRVVETASRLFREQGTHVSVADLMKAAGLTHGGFYKQFASKEALVGEATAHAFGELVRRRDTGSGRRAEGRDDARRALVDAYLSVEHRDDAADGCPVAGLAADMARGHADLEARRVYAEGVRGFAEWLDVKGAEGAEGQDGIVRLCTLFGALALARATKDFPISEEILAAARATLTTADWAEEGRTGGGRGAGRADGAAFTQDAMPRSRRTRHHVHAERGAGTA